MIDEEKFTLLLRLKFESYSSISNESWQLIKEHIRYESFNRGENILMEGEISRKIYFVCKGTVRAFCSDVNGDSYNKNLFLENDFAGSTVSAIQKKPSKFTLEALEESLLISINYHKYRELIYNNDDLKEFYIAYLERNWIIEKEQREVSLVLENATVRYLRFISLSPNIDKKIPLQHIASHLGITPTQLSRIRKNIKKASSQHM
jgi:signal-transduction protein with cAMP-binding, CBS, and nucleotidyltransferase domain